MESLTRHQMLKQLSFSPNLLEVLLTYQLAKWLNSWLDSPTRVTKICLLNQWKLHSTTPWIILLLFKTSLPFNVAYSSEGRVYSESVFNETINIVEVDDGLDGETFFLYVFFAAGIVLLLVLGQQALSSMGKRRGGAPRVETGTTRNSGNVSDDGIDYDWLPKETLNELNKSPKGSPRRSPRLRKSKAGSGSE